MWGMSRCLRFYFSGEKNFFCCNNTNVTEEAAFSFILFIFFIFFFTKPRLFKWLNLVKQQMVFIFTQSSDSIYII